MRLQSLLLLVVLLGSQLPAASGRRNRGECGSVPLLQVPGSSYPSGEREGLGEAGNSVHVCVCPVDVCFSVLAFRLCFFVPVSLPMSMSANAFWPVSQRSSGPVFTAECGVPGALRPISVLYMWIFVPLCIVGTRLSVLLLLWLSPQRSGSVIL